MDSSFCSLPIGRCRWVGHWHSYPSGPSEIYLLLVWILTWVTGLLLLPSPRTNSQNWNFRCFGRPNLIANWLILLLAVFVQVHWWTMQFPYLFGCLSVVVAGYAHLILPQMNFGDYGSCHFMHPFRLLLSVKYSFLMIWPEPIVWNSIISGLLASPSSVARPVWLMDPGMARISVMQVPLKSSLTKLAATLWSFRSSPHIYLHILLWSRQETPHYQPFCEWAGLPGLREEARFTAWVQCSMRGLSAFWMLIYWISFLKPEAGFRRHSGW